MDATLSDIDLPLYVDLDGTLVNTDVAQELLLQVVARPKAWGPLARSLTQGRAEAKQFLAQDGEFDPATLPYVPEVLEYLRAEKARGRRVVLASATDIRVAEKVAAHLGLFDAVIASTDGDNLKGARKLEAIKEDGGEAFEYLGDSNADRVIWKSAAVSGFVNAPAPASDLVAPEGRVSLDIREKHSVLDGIRRAMRPHQWAKNALILLPLFFSHQYGDTELVMRALLAVIIFSFCASAIYIFNDLLDIEADRHHAKKRFRPFAAGTLSPVKGVIASAVLLIVSLGVSALYYGFAFTGLFLFYVLSTTLYSTWLKHKPVIDVVVLTCLYTLRIFVGGVAIGAALSPWLLNFSLFFFASLAFMKRYTEMRRVEAAGKDGARGYLVDDLTAILPMGVSCGGLAVLTLTLYLNSAFVAATYGAVEILWLIAPLIMFWIFRAWLKALRDEIDDDPVVFAMRDRTSQLTLLLTVMVVLASKFLTLNGVAL